MRPGHLLLFALCWSITAGTAAPAARQDKVDKNQPAKKGKTEPVPGFKMQKIEGFTFLIEEEVFKTDVSKYERKPLEVLELECRTLAKILSPKALDTLKALVIWVKWDDRMPLTNGRKGSAVAVYYGGTPALMAKAGKHPLQAKTVTIHSLRLLTEARQPTRDRGDCLLLHEIAHAVHDQLLGFNHAGIKAAYQQAMERQLYDKDLYIATNEREFFAELTCAYLDKLPYYPYTRADLAKHDPASFKLMESIWSGAAKKNATAKKTAADGSDVFDLKITLREDIKFGQVAAGPAPTADSLAGKVVVIGYWGGSSANVLNKLDRIHQELAPYGLIAIAPCATGKTIEEIREEAAKRCEGIAVLDRVFVTDRSTPGQMRTQPGGHALVFDHAGKCIYRGSAYDAEKWARAAIGKKLLAEAMNDGEASPAFKAVVEAFTAGSDPVAVLPKLNPLVNSQDEQTKVAAKKLAEAILAPGQKALEDARANAKDDPVGAFIAAEAIVSRYKNTSLAAKGQNIVSKLRSDRSVATELKARTILAQVQKAETYLRGQPGSFDPTDSTFQSRNRAVLSQIHTSLAQLRKQYPNARATAEAGKIAREFGVE